jgi:hypothetical protein
MKRWLIVLLLLLLPVVGLAQPTPQVKWEHDGLNVTSFTCVVDAGTPTTLSPTGPVGTTYSVDITACTGVMVNGTHTLIIQACNAGGCTNATAITVVKL